MLMLAGLVTAVQAELIEDFEGYDEGVVSGFGNGVEIVTDTGANGTQVLMQTTTTGGGWQGAGVDLDPDVDGVNYSGATQIQFDAYISSGYDGVVGVSSWNGIDYTNFNDFQGMIRGNTSADALDYRNDGSYITIDSAIADVDEWHTYVFDMDWANNQYDIYVDGALLIADAGMRQTDQTKTGSFRMLGTDYSSGYAMVDNITVVPEPATMLLLGLGSLAALRKRK